ncbi:MAG: hypothetical protein HZC22_04185 [Rhodocyclales bacterium]|nr:hypothetical protein [Rhodocyclales bacterium]
MTSASRFWQGQVPLAKTFWLGWAIPVVAGNVLVSRAAWWLISNLGLVPFYLTVALVAGYSIVAVVPVWRSASTYGGSRLLKYGARGLASLTSAVQVVAVGTVVFALVSIRMGIDPTSDPERIAEKTAIPSETHPLAGFWKYSANDNFGLAIAPAEGNLYSVSFCGPGGCFKPGTYRPNTPIAGDGDFQVVSNDTIRLRRADGWSTVTRSAGRGGDDCPKP